MDIDFINELRCGMSAQGIRFALTRCVTVRYVEHRLNQLIWGMVGHRTCSFIIVQTNPVIPRIGKLMRLALRCVTL